MPILISCLKRDDTGGDRSKECKRFEDEVNRKVSKIKDKKRGDLGKACRCSTKKDVECCPGIYCEEEKLSL
jgi:hypothetical protein